jgi:hypothetical protein
MGLSIPLLKTTHDICSRTRCKAPPHHDYIRPRYQRFLKDAIEQDRVAFINVAVNRFENVLPMVPAGGALYNMMLDDQQEEK